jgi:hypothetical protein
MSALAIAVTRISTITPITSIIGAGAVHAMQAPQEAPIPYLVLHLIDEPDEQMLAGRGGYYDSRIQIDCIGRTASEANKLGELLKVNFPCVKQTVAINNESPPDVATDVDISKESSDFSDSADDRSSFRRACDYKIRWR